MLRIPTAESFFGPRLRRSLGQQVFTSDETHGADRWRQLAAETEIPVPFWPQILYGDSGMLVAPTGTEKKHPLLAHVRHGRWFVVCECGSAQHAAFTDQRFYCIACHNGSVGGAFRTVVWPKNPEQIESLLLERPVERRHWFAHETTQDLAEQNKLLVAMAAA